MLSESAIGVFDSGVGGLSVLSALHRALPNEKYLYFADTARLPYGEKTPEQIHAYVLEILDFMQSKGVKMVVVACNTSSALALEHVKEGYSFPIVGTVAPTVEAIALNKKRIGVIATSATIQSGSFERTLRKHNPELQVHSMACPEFVPLIEANRLEEEYTLEVAKKYLQPLIEADIDALIYGCTHYPFLENVIRPLLPKHTQLVDPAHFVVAKVKEILTHHKGHNELPQGGTEYFVSQDAEKFSTSATRWLGLKPSVKEVNVSNAQLIHTSAQYADPNAPFDRGQLA